MSDNKTRPQPAQASGFLCPFCGGKAGDPGAYHSQLTSILIIRFLDLLNSKDEPGYFDGVLDCIHAVFGPGNLMVRQELQKAGHIEEYEDRFGKGQEGSAHKLRCSKCRELKDDWKITVDTDTQFCEYICEDCLSKTQKARTSMNEEVEEKK